MDWSEEEKKALGMAFIETMRANGNEHATQVLDGGWYEGFCAIASRAVELAAARFNTMTEETLRYALRSEDWGGIEREFALHGARLMALSEQISAKEARNAVLEAETKGLRERCEDLEARRLAAEESNRELVRRAQRAEAQRDRLETMCREQVRRAKEAEDRCATLSAAGQTPINQAGRTIPAEASGEVVLMVGPIDHYPCSPACTHDDAAKPGHPERVKERSEAFSTATHADYGGELREEHEDASAAEKEPVSAATEENPTTEAYDAGSEAMRAACWEAVRLELVKFGVARDEPMYVGMKSAIEGAGP